MSEPEEAVPIPSERQQFILDAVLKVGPSPSVVSAGDTAAARAQLHVSVLSGGITNELYRVKNTQTGHSVVVRVYGKETDRLISRDAEQFFQSKFLKTFGRHENALVYEFLDGMRALEPDELPHHAAAIATTLAEFHARASTYALHALPYATQELHSINVTTTWFAVAKHAIATVPKLAHLKAQVGAIEEACNFIRALLQKAKSHLPVVVCHNDLLSGNIMVTKDVTAPIQSTRFIDFEYCRRDFALYDIANNWHEWAGYDNNFAKYPAPAQQRAFLTAYYTAIAQQTSASAEELAAMTSEESISRACVVANFLSLSAILTWSIWSIVQYAYSAIEFDYLDYFNKKFERFNATKKEFSEPFIKEILKE